MAYKNLGAKVSPGFTVVLCITLLVGSTLRGKAQGKFTVMEELFTTPKHYVVQHTDQHLKIDGFLDESAWLKASWTTEFEDIEGPKRPLPTYPTRVKMLWNDSTLFIGADLREPQVWATQMQHDDIIFKDNDFEVFIDPDNDTHGYFEIEVNAFNKIFDLFLPKPYRNGGDALVSWDIAGLQSAIKVEGSLNEPGDTDKGWFVEMAIPLKALRMGHPVHVPEEGAIWRINFSRVEWDTKIVGDRNVKLKDKSGHNLPEHNWVWSPQGVIDMHYPERWGYLQFTRNTHTAFELPYSELQRRYLWLIYYKQKEHMKTYGRYAETLKALNIDPRVDIMNRNNALEMTANAKQFTATIALEGGVAIRIDDQGFVR